MNPLFQRSEWIIEQTKEWPEIILGFEGANRYVIRSSEGARIGYVAEQSRGIFAFFMRWLLRSHRPLTAHIFDESGQLQFQLERPFFWIWSSMRVFRATGPSDSSGLSSGELGEVHRRFGFFFWKTYELFLPGGQRFMKISGGPFRIWTFDFLDCSNPGTPESKVGIITKKWGGLLKEFFTDADRYLVRLDRRPESWPETAIPVLLAAAISVDFDYFEENQRKLSVIDGVDP